MRQKKKTNDGSFSDTPDKDRPPSQSSNLQHERIKMRSLLFKRSYVSYIFFGIILLILGTMVRAVVYYYFVFEINAKITSLIMGTGEIFKLLGLMIFILGIIYGALFDESLHPHIRAGMFIGLGLMLSFVITASPGF